MIIRSIKLKLEGNPFYYILRLQGVGVDGSQYKNKSAVALTNSSLLLKGFHFLRLGSSDQNRTLHSFELSFSDSKKNIWSIFRTKRCFVIQKNFKKIALDYKQLIDKLVQIEKLDMSQYGSFQLVESSLIQRNDDTYSFFQIQDASRLKESAEEEIDTRCSFLLHLSNNESEVNSYAKIGYGWGYTGKVAL